MSNNTNVELVSYNIDNVEICASAARISTTQGNAIEIFEKAQGNEKNQDLVKKVLNSGHKSVIEHVVFTLAMKDVSAFVEQFFIECRLASFTVKSRRYVDFSKLGYHIPTDLSDKEKDLYCKYMDNLFDAYQKLLDNDIPREDARFVLPYAFNSNFYCTLNARELCHIINEIKFGRGKDIPELQDLASQIVRKVEKVFPCINFEIDLETSENNQYKDKVNEIKIDDEITLIDAKNIGGVSILNVPSNPMKVLAMAYEVNHHSDMKDIKISDLLNSERPRELEQLSYSFLISNITLSGITHIVRHRMQSIIIPSIKGIEHSKFIIPETIKNNEKAFEIYKNILEASNEMMKQMKDNENLKRYSYYYALSGNVMDIMTTINARELMHFIKLRTCNRAQWEIRDIAVDMLKQLRKSCPELFNSFGPSCFVTGVCPEGRMTCGKRLEVIEEFKCLK